jgi:hypothetical protein
MTSKRTTNLASHTFNFRPGGNGVEIHIAGQWLILTQAELSTLYHGGKPPWDK